MTITHRKSGTGVYRAWSSMMTRCRNPKCHNYYRYGGRGIRVCERWHDFSNFYADMGDRPSGYSLERIDYDGNYEPGNCTWIPNRLQARNKSNTKRITIDGVTKPLAEWCEVFGVASDLAWRRITWCKWDEAKAVSTPKGVPMGRHGEANVNAVLTVEAVRDIRASAETYATLAARYGTTKTAIYEVRKRRTWKHVT